MKLRNKKINILVDGIAIPIIVFVVVTYFVAIIGNRINENINPILVQGIANTIAICILIPFYIYFNKSNNLKSNPLSFKMIIYAISLGISLCYICNSIISFLPRVKTNIVTENVYKLTEELNVYVTLFIITIIVPLTEEIIFRGFFYDAIKIISNEYIAIILTSITFAFAHSDLQQILYAFIAGIFLAYIKYKCNNIIYSVIMHFIMNFTAYILVPNIILNNKIDIFTMFIMISILILSIFRINLYNNEKI